ncbi:hypothetical protein AGLY_003923 [Aphis glycines]|uniref:Uncharacterized protein n=1 Tax=Aphis glycines TaxID=307491 RepID=A0A6G0TX03_APHGL|nr:hypothetical protein AGLY_003923 [Aphis glycines]
MHHIDTTINKSGTDPLSKAFLNNKICLNHNIIQFYIQTSSPVDLVLVYGCLNPINCKSCPRTKGYNIPIIENEIKKKNPNPSQDGQKIIWNIKKITYRDFSLIVSVLDNRALVQVEHFFFKRLDFLSSSYSTEILSFELKSETLKIETQVNLHSTSQHFSLQQLSTRLENIKDDITDNKNSKIKY